MMINKFTFYLILLLLIPLGIACGEGTNETSGEVNMANEYYAFIELEDQNGENMGKVKIESVSYTHLTLPTSDLV